MVLLEAGADVVEGLVDGIGELQHFKFAFVDGAGIHHGLPIQNLIPIFSAVDKDDVVLGEFVRLHEGEHFHELVEGAEAAGKNYEGFGDLCEPELPHEEVMEIETKFGADIGVGELFVWELDGKADGFASRFGGAAIGGFHDAGSSTGTNYEATRPWAQGHGPGSDSTRELTGFFVVAGHFQQTLGAANGGAVLHAIDGGDFLGREGTLSGCNGRGPDRGAEYALNQT